MFRTRVARILLVPAALLIPASIATVAFASSSSAASPNAAAKAVKCSTLSGTILATGSVSGCTDTANTGGGGTFPTSGSNPTTIKWTSGGKTTATINYSGGSGKCATGDTQEDVTGNVTKDKGVAKSVKIGPISGTVCVSADGALSLAPGTKLVIG
jgi:hypothetical protein